jgi:DNA-binding GntR family transcriptional regulator
MAGQDSNVRENAGTEVGEDQRVRRITLHDQVVTRLRDLIVEGQLAPGSRVPERELCERFDISRTPLREAMKVLAWEGLLDLSPNRGASVSEVSIEAVDEVFPVMGALEALSGELACRYVTDAEIEAINACHQRMVRHYRRRQLDEYFRCNQEIHEAILRAARNPTLARTYQGLSGRVRRMRYIANLEQSRWDQAVSEHEDMLRALHERNGEALAHILRTHLKNKLDAVKDYLVQRKGTTDAD